MIIILDESPWNTHILVIEDEEISTFWHGHRNRCFIFSCELSKKQNVTLWTVIVLVFQYIT